MINYSYSPRPIFDPSESLKTQFEKIVCVPAALKPVSQQFPLVNPVDRDSECAGPSSSSRSQLGGAALPPESLSLKRDESVNMIVASRKNRERFAIKKSYSIEVTRWKVLVSHIAPIPILKNHPFVHECNFMSEWLSIKTTFTGG